MALNYGRKCNEERDYSDKTIEIDANNANAWINKGVEHYNLRKYEEAINCFNEAIKLDADNGMTWYRIGLAHLFSTNIKNL